MPDRSAALQQLQEVRAQKQQTKERREQREDDGEESVTHVVHNMKECRVRLTRPEDSRDPSLRRMFARAQRKYDTSSRRSAAVPLSAVVPLNFVDPSFAAATVVFDVDDEMVDGVVDASSFCDPLAKSWRAGEERRVRRSALLAAVPEKQTTPVPDPIPSTPSSAKPDRRTVDDRREVVPSKRRRLSRSAVVDQSMTALRQTVAPIVHHSVHRVARRVLDKRQTRTTGDRRNSAATSSGTQKERAPLPAPQTDEGADSVKVTKQKPSLSIALPSENSNQAPASVTPVQPATPQPKKPSILDKLLPPTPPIARANPAKPRDQSASSAPSTPANELLGKVLQVLAPRNTEEIHDSPPPLVIDEGDDMGDVKPRVVKRVTFADERGGQLSTTTEFASSDQQHVRQHDWRRGRERQRDVELDNYKYRDLYVDELASFREAWWREYQSGSLLPPLADEDAYNTVLRNCKTAEQPRDFVDVGSYFETFQPFLLSETLEYVHQTRVPKQPSFSLHHAKHHERQRDDRGAQHHITLEMGGMFTHAEVSSVHFQTAMQADNLLQVTAKFREVRTTGDEGEEENRPAPKEFDLRLTGVVVKRKFREIENNDRSSCPEYIISHHALAHPRSPPDSTTPNGGTPAASPSAAERMFELIMLVRVKYEPTRNMTMLNNVEISYIANISRYIRQAEAFDYMAVSPLRDIIRNPSAHPNILPPPTEHDKLHIDRSQLTEEQASIVHRVSTDIITHQHTPNVSVIEGASGTGKTYTVAAIVEEVVKRKKQQEVNGVVVVCASSAASADHLTTIMHEKNDPEDHYRDIQIVSLLDPMRHFAADIKRFTLSRLMDKRMHTYGTVEKIESQLAKLDDDIRRLRSHGGGSIVAGMGSKHDMLREKRARLLRMRERRERNEQIRESDVEAERFECMSTADVIVTTPSTLAGHLSTLPELMASLNTLCVLVDDANSCTELDTLLAMHLQPKKLILTHDRSAVRAHVQNHLIANSVYNRSLTSRIVGSDSLRLHKHMRAHPLLHREAVLSIAQFAGTVANDAAHLRTPNAHFQLVYGNGRNYSLRRAALFVGEINDHSAIVMDIYHCIMRHCPNEPLVTVVVPSKTVEQTMRLKMSHLPKHTFEVVAVESLRLRERPLIISLLPSVDVDNDHHVSRRQQLQHLVMGQASQAIYVVSSEVVANASPLNHFDKSSVLRISHNQAAHRNTIDSFLIR